MDHYETGIHEGIVQWVREHNWELDASCIPIMTAPPTVPCDGILTTITKVTSAGLLGGYDCPVVRMFAGASDEVDRLCAEIPLVCVDYHSAGRLGAQHLLTLGQPEFAFYKRGVGPDTNAIRNGFMEAMREAGHQPALIDFQEDHPHLDATRRVSRELRLVWLMSRIQRLRLPCAIMAEDDRFAIDLMYVAGALGLNIPADIAILGMDDNRLTLGVSPIGISSVDANLKGVGYHAAQLLSELIGGATKPDGPIRVRSERVVARQSTATYSGGHQGVSEALRFVRQRFREPLSAARVARQARMSLRGLQNALRNEGGITLNAEISRLRLAAATRLLEETDLKLDSIAADVGLHDAKNLCRVFKQRYAMTPQQWREKAQRMKSATS
jgi:LacI family transcriptional regulator